MMTLLVAWVWQGLLLVAIVEIGLRLSPRVNATTRHAIWWLALVAVLMLPLAAQIPSGSPGVASGGLSTGPETVAGWMPGLAPLHLPSPPDWALAMLVGGWAGTVLLAIVRLARSVAFLRRLKAESRAMPASQQNKLLSWTTAATDRRRVELRVSDHHPGACALGLGSPIILVSAALADVLEPDELDAIVIHEYAHLARRDDWTRLVQAIVEALTGLHPAVQLIARRIHFEREAACDDWAAARAASPLHYATYLTEFAARFAAPAGQALMPGALGERGSLGRRVARILDPECERGRRLTRSALGAAALAIASVLALAVADPFIMVGGETGNRTAPASALLAPPPPVASTARAANLEGQQRPVPSTLAFVSAETEPLRPSTSVAQHIVRVSPDISPAIATHDTAPPTIVALAARPITYPAHAAPDLHTSEVPTTPPAADANTRPWARGAAAGSALGSGAARGGTSMGSGARQAGVSIGRFFGRAGKAIGGSF